MKKILLLPVFLLLIITTYAQVQQGGSPYSSLNNFPPNTKSTIVFPLVDLEKLAAEDAIFDLQKDIPYRFGFNFDTDYSTQNSGEWTILSNGDRVWRLSFYSENAQSLNFLLENYKLAEGASLFFYNEDYNTVLGSFTHKNNREHKNLSTMPIPGDKITLEFYEPASQRNKSTFKVTRVTHGYRSIKIPTKGVGDSGNCNNNVICAVGDDWRDQIRSVGIIIVGGSGNCTGALVNNTCEDKKPYFLTANHCLGGNVTTWSIGFNWESAACSGNSGYQNISLESINVLALRANNDGSDFALLELTQTPPISYGVYYAGWDNSGTNPVSQVGIHHPAGDLKKITFDTDAAGTATWGSAATWHILDWEDGTTEPGSSGSPLFDQNKRIIGQLYGGTASCSNNIDDYYGRFDVSWDNGTGSSNELESWLDPLGSGQTVIDGLDASTIISDDVTIQFLNKPSLINCGVNIPQDILLTNYGTNTATQISFEYGLSDNVQTYNWTGSLTSGQSETISFDKLILCNGEYNYILGITSYNTTIDLVLCNNRDDFSFEGVNGDELNIEIQTNLEGSESSFEVFNSDSVVIFSQATFSDNQSHTFNICLPYGDYYFKMYDSGANGLTPSFFFDPGFYSLSINGVEFQNNDDFGSEETTSFSSFANGLKADFMVEDEMAETNFNLINGSPGFPTFFLWEAPDANITTGNSALFTTSFPATGIYPITFTVKTDSSCDVVTKNITIIENTVGIETPSFFNEIVYPNPAKDILYISTEQYANTSISIYNALGQKLSHKIMNKNKETLSLSNFSKGLYYVVLENENYSNLNKLIIK